MRRDTELGFVSRGFHEITCLFRNAILTDVSVKELEPQGLNFCWNTHVSWGEKMSSWPRECSSFWETLLSLIWRVSDAAGLSGLPLCCRLAWDHTWPCWPQGRGRGRGGTPVLACLTYTHTHSQAWETFPPQRHVLWLHLYFYDKTIPHSSERK